MEPNEPINEFVWQKARSIYFIWEHIQIHIYVYLFPKVFKITEYFRISHFMCGLNVCTCMLWLWLTEQRPIKSNVKCVVLSSAHTACNWTPVQHTEREGAIRDLLPYLDCDLSMRCGGLRHFFICNSNFSSPAWRAFLAFSCHIILYFNIMHCM